METNKCYNENCLDTMGKMPDGFVVKLPFFNYFYFFSFSLNSPSRRVSFLFWYPLSIFRISALKTPFSSLWMAVLILSRLQFFAYEGKKSTLSDAFVILPHANTGEEPRGRTRHAQDKPCDRIYNLPRTACKIRGLRINRRGYRAYAQGGRAQDKEHPAHGDGDGFHS